jgi:hypothetical protein
MPEKENSDPLEGWHPADEAPKGLFSLSHRGHVMRSKPIWLLQGAHTYQELNHDEPWKDDGPQVTDPPLMILGYCVWPQHRFFGKYKDGHKWGKTGEYEQWLPTKEHYFVSLEHDCEEIFPAQYWREIEHPIVPSWAIDDDFRWGARHCGGIRTSGEYEVGERSKYLEGLRRASTDEEPFRDKAEEPKP